MVCIADPRFDDHFHKQRFHGRKRANMIAQHGKGKRGWSDEELRELAVPLEAILSAAKDGRARLEAIKAHSENESQPERIVKRRKGADAHISSQVVVIQRGSRQ